MEKTRFKICGLTRIQDVRAALRAGADALGFVFEPTSPRFVGDQQDFLDEVSAVDPWIPKVAVFGPYQESAWVPAGWWVQCTEGRPRESHPWIQTLRISPGQSEIEIDRDAKMILLDPYVPGQHGGTGQRISIEILGDLLKGIDRPVVIAGGLNSDNVQEVLSVVHPYAVDASSGLESAPGIKDEEKIRRFARAIRESDEFLAKKGRDR